MNSILRKNLAGSPMVEETGMDTESSQIERKKLINSKLNENYFSSK
jgi:hypothetical protein